MGVFITEDDTWGIRRAVRILWDKQFNTTHWIYNNVWHATHHTDLCFDAFFNQQVPEAWRETLATVKRHAGDIGALMSAPNFRPDIVWYRRNNQLNSGPLNDQLVQSIKKGEVELPIYIEIEEEKQKWQSHPQYNKDRGLSSPIREELIQIRIHK